MIKQTWHSLKQIPSKLWLSQRLKSLGIELKRTHEAVPFDWSDLERGSYPKTRITITYQRLSTWFEWEQRLPTMPPEHRWNSEHIAYHFGSVTNQYGTQADEGDADFSLWTAKPLWGLLGEHSYAD